MKLIFSHPTGNSNVRAAALGLADAGLLKNFYTTIATFDDAPAILTKGPLSELNRRKYDIALKAYTKASPWLEAIRLFASKAGFKSLIEHEKGYFSIDAVYTHLDNLVAKSLNKYSDGHPLGVYAYEDGAVNSFKKAKQLGLPRYYDLPIGYWRSARLLLKDEIEKWPDWASTMNGFRDSNEKLLRKDEELGLASHIFVASTFTAKTLLDYPGALAPVSIIPYGFPSAAAKREYTLNKKKLKILFVGGLSQRKGIANLFAAVDSFTDYIELTLVGRKTTEDCTALNTALNKHTWISSLSHGDILKIMRESDLLIFPSLFEGFGLVISEAMSQGTPVITTDRTAGPDLIQHDHNGWIIEAGSVSAIQDLIQDLLSDPGKIAKAGFAARQTAMERPWAVYGKELANAIENIT